MREGLSATRLWQSTV